jgi:hypothetical protein
LVDPSLAFRLERRRLADLSDEADAQAFVGGKAFA